MDHGLRRRRLEGHLERLALEAILVTFPPNVRYLTGFTGSNGAVLVTADRWELVTDGRYVLQASRELAHSGDPAVVVVESTPVRAVERLAGSSAVRRVAFETTVSYEDYTKLADAAAGRVELVGVAGLVEGLRAVKDADELDLLQRAAALTDGAFAEILERLRPGFTEREVALDLEVAVRRAGAGDVAFEPIVAFGEYAAEPHHAPTERPLRRGDVIKLDFGALLGGYHADMTRTVSCGRPPDELREVHALVVDAQTAAVRAVRPGMRLGELDDAARDPIGRAGYADRYTHPLGHGVGLEIHEWPVLRSGSDETVPRDAVITIEPGVYLPGVGGVRIEDMVAVGDEGPLVLTRSTKELVEL